MGLVDYDPKREIPYSRRCRHYFFGAVVTKLVDQLKMEYGVGGTQIPYRFSALGKTILHRMQQYFRRGAVNTHAFGFDQSSIELSRGKIINAIGNSGSKVIRHIFSVIDFLDRIILYISRKTGIFYLDSIGQARLGAHGREGPFESKMISFSAVGSGFAFFHGYTKSPSPSYEKFATSSYSPFAR